MNIQEKRNRNPRKGKLDNRIYYKKNDISMDFHPKKKEAFIEGRIHNYDNI
jgi:hypothetical protein